MDSCTGIRIGYVHHELGSALSAWLRIIDLANCIESWLVLASTTDAVCRPSVVGHHSAPRQCGCTSQQHRCDMPAVLILVAVRAARGSLSCLCAAACALFALGIACCMCVYCMHPQHRVRRHRQCLQGYPISSRAPRVVARTHASPYRCACPLVCCCMCMFAGVFHACWCIAALLLLL